MVGVEDGMQTLLGTEMVRGTGIVREFINEEGETLHTLSVGTTEEGILSVAQLDDHTHLARRNEHPVNLERGGIGTYIISLDAKLDIPENFTGSFGWGLWNDFWPVEGTPKAKQRRFLNDYAPAAPIKTIWFEGTPGGRKDFGQQDAEAPLNAGLINMSIIGTLGMATGHPKEEEYQVASITNIDLSDWHNYQIKIQKGAQTDNSKGPWEVIFLIDEVPVVFGRDETGKDISTILVDRLPNKLGNVVWIDNNWANVDPKKGKFDFGPATNTKGATLEIKNYSVISE